MINFSVKKVGNFSALVAGGLMFLVALNLFIFLIVGDVNLDITSDGKYSLSDKTENFLKNNDQRINVRFFVSKDLKSKNFKLAEYAEYLRKIFMEYKNKSNGMIDITFVDVVPFENSQFEAEKYGVKEFDFNDGKKYQYLGASFSNIEGKYQSISQFHPERKFFVEDDITRLLSVVAKKSKPYLGVVSPLFSIAEEGNFVKQIPNWPFIKNMENFGYHVIPIRSTTPVIDENIDVVLLFYPVDMTTSFMYALDQYLVKGGNVVIMMDSFAEERFRDLEEYYGYRSGMLNFLKKHGVSYSEDLLVGDNISSRSVVMDKQKVQYPFKINITNDMLANHPINENIDLVYYNHGGFFKYEEQENMIMIPIAKTSANSGIMSAENMTDLGYNELLRNYVISNESKILALLIQGKFKPYYEYPPITDVDLIKKLPLFISAPSKEGKLLLLGDSDIVNEVLWNADVGNKNGIYDITYSSDNLLFLRNIFDFMSESGYVSAGKKYIVKNDVNLVDVFKKMAFDFYDNDRQKVLNQLNEVKEKMISIEMNKSGFDIHSIKTTKERELLMRQETDLNLLLRKIIYLIEEKYNLFRIGFSFFVIFMLPVLISFAVGMMYMFYNRMIAKKAKECIHE